MPHRLRSFVARHRTLLKRTFFVVMALLVAGSVAVVYYLESLNVWRALFTSMTKWEMMVFIVLANACVFVVLMLAFKISHWLQDDDGPET